MTTTYKLRDYQEKAIDQAEHLLYKKDFRSGVLHLFTGAGKSLLTAVGVDKFANPRNGARSIIVGGVNRILVFQMLHNLQKYFPYMKGNVLQNGATAPATGIVMGNINQTDARSIVASIQSLTAGVDVGRIGKKNHILSVPIEKSDIIVDKYGRVRKNPSSPRPFLVSPRIDEMLAAGGLFDLWIHDEAHHSVSDGSVYLIHMLQQIHALMGVAPMKLIGNTATPKRADERGLHTLYETVIVSYGIPWGQAHGYLVPFWQQDGKHAERVVIDEYEVDDMGQGTLANQQTTMRYVDNWAEIAAQGYLDRMQGRRCFAYWDKYNGAGAIEDSIWVTSVMNSIGIRAAHIDGQKCIDENGNVLPKRDEGKLLKRLACGDLMVINNFGVLTEGVDVPEVDGILLGRRISADNPVLLTQIIGRGLRPAPGKDNLKILDYTGKPLVISSLADLMGFTVDPFSGRLLDDVNWQLVIQQFMALWTSRPEDVEKWIHIQKRYKEKTIREAINRALRSEEMEEVHIRIMKECYEFCNDEDRLAEGIDLRDQRELNMVHGKNATYQLVKIITKSSGAWYADPKTAAMSLSVGEEQCFYIHPPNHTLGRIADAALAALTGDADHPLTKGKSSEQIVTTIEFFTTAKEFFDNFTLWHISGPPWASHVEGGQIFGDMQGRWVLADSALDTLEDDGTAYARDIPGYKPVLSDKKKTNKWGKEKPTEKQLPMLSRLAGIPIEKMPEEWKMSTDEGGVGKGGVAKLITHYAAQNAIKPIIDRLNKAMEKVREIV